MTRVRAIELVGGLDGIRFNDPADHQNQTVFSWLNQLGGGMRIDRYGTDNLNLIDTAVTESPVPEPGTLGLVITALVAAGAYVRKLRARSVGSCAEQLGQQAHSNGECMSVMRGVVLAGSN